MSRTWDSTMSIIPKGGETIWGGLDWSPEEGYIPKNKTQGNNNTSVSTSQAKNPNYGRLISFGRNVAESHSSQIERVDFRGGEGKQGLIRRGEYDHDPPSNLLEGRGTESGAHVDILGNFQLHEDVLRVATGASGEDLGGDRVYTNIFKWVKDVRTFLDDMFFPRDTPSPWIKAIPAKVNILMWRARKNYLPTRSNLAIRVIPIVSLLCPVCLAEQEDTSHIFFRCNMVQNILNRVTR
nr:phospholipid:diacylglycerol acyltransferase [Tanacetum cinerariifolium]